MLNAGKYNRLINIYGFKEVEDNEGFNNSKEKLILTTYASVKTTRGYTLLKNDTDFEKAYTNFTIRYPLIEITRDMIIQYNSKFYTIEYLNNINEDNVELEIQAKLVEK